jgi:hypothetical protein
VNRLFATLMLVVSPLLLAATDPRGDTRRCTRGGAEVADEGSIDIIGSTARVTEGGFAIRFDIRFAEPPPLPDLEGRPLRVDVLVRDPNVATVSFAYYREVNRIVRFDAVPDPTIQVLLLPERGNNTFLGATFAGDTLTMELPGRLLTRDADLEGPPIEGLTWSVIARDENECDLLGNGIPTLPVTGTVRSSSDKPVLDHPRGRAPWPFVVFLGALIAFLWIYAVSVLRRDRRRDSLR